MKRFLLVLLLIIVSCDKSFKTPEPDNLIDQPVMEEILYDISLLKAAKSKSYKIIKDNNVQADVYIYEKYKIDSITLRQNIEYYTTTSFKKSKEIEERIRLRFDADKAKVEKIIQDSLKIKKDKDSVKLSGKRVEKEPIDNVLEANSLIVSSDSKDWILVHSILKKEKSIINGDRFDIIKLIANNNNNQHRIDIPTKLLEDEYEFSIYAKKAEIGFVRLRIGNSGYPIVFDLEKGTIIGSQEGVVASIKEKELKWFKCSIKCSVNKISVIRVNVFSSNSVSDYSGDEIKGVYLREFELKRIEKI